jgi:hypothetical protein
MASTPSRDGSSAESKNSSTSSSTPVGDHAHHQYIRHVLLHDHSIALPLIDIIMEYYRSHARLWLFGSYGDDRAVWSISLYDLLQWYQLAQTAREAKTSAAAVVVPTSTTSTPSFSSSSSLPLWYEWTTHYSLFREGVSAR